MRTNTCRAFFIIPLVVALAGGCSDGSAASKLGADAKAAGKDAVAAAKDVGGKMGDGISEAVASLESFSKSVANDAGESGEALAQGVQAKLPDFENLVDKAKARLAAGGAEGKAMASKLDDKLATLKSKTETLAHNAATATKEMKDDVVAACNDLVADIKSAVSK